MLILCLRVVCVGRTMRVMSTPGQIPAEIDQDAISRVEEFAGAQLLWLARRGDKAQRRAARAMASMIPRLAAEIRAYQASGHTGQEDQYDG